MHPSDQWYTESEECDSQPFKDKSDTLGGKAEFKKKKARKEPGGWGGGLGNNEKNENWSLCVHLGKTRSRIISD